MAYVTQLSLLFVCQKEIKISLNRTAHIMLQPTFMAASYHTMFAFQDPTMILVYPFDLYRSFYPIAL